MKKREAKFVGKLPNHPLKALDRKGLMLAIRQHVLMMISGNFDRFVPEAEDEQIEMNIHSAETAAQMLAKRAMKLIGKNYTPDAGFDAPYSPRLRDLSAVLGGAATATVITLGGPDGRNNVKIGENPSFIIATMGCADGILVDVLVEPRKTQNS